MQQAPTNEQVKRSWNYTSILFVTDRLLIGPGPSSVSTLAGSAFNYDNYFSNQSTSSLSLGQACVTFPIDRKPGEQTYASSPDFENPAKSFALKIAPLFTAPENFEARMKASPSTDESGQGCPSTWNGKSKRPLLFIHGWNTAFTAAITRATQLKVDLDHNDVIVFTWPSDKPGFIIKSYGAAESEGLIAATFVPRVLRHIRDGSGDYPNVIAHSMGARVYSDGMAYLSGHGANATNSKESVPAVVLAAPDVPAKTFRTEFPKFSHFNLITTIYCSTYDKALLGAEVLRGTARLGQCEPATDTGGVAEEIVQVTGGFRDIWHHSYFLSAPEMINDMKIVFGRAHFDPDKGHRVLSFGDFDGLNGFEYELNGLE